MRDKIGPVAAFKIAIVVKRLPKTRSGKTLRGTMKKIADDETWTMPATIDDPAVLSEIAAALQRRLSRAESKLQELRNEVGNLAFAIWEKRVKEEGATLGMHRPIGSQPAMSWASLQISFCNFQLTYPVNYVSAYNPSFRALARCA